MKILGKPKGKIHISKVGMKSIKFKGNDKRKWSLPWE